MKIVQFLKDQGDVFDVSFLNIKFKDFSMTSCSSGFVHALQWEDKTLQLKSFVSGLQLMIIFIIDESFGL